MFARWDLNLSSSCQFGADIQNIQRIVEDSPLTCFEGTIQDINLLGMEAVDWQHN